MQAFWEILRRITYIILIAIGFASCENQRSEEITAAADTLVVEEPKELLFGFDLDSFEVVQNVIKPNQFLADILLDQDVPYPVIHEIAVQSKEVFDVRRLERGKPYTIFRRKDSARTAQYFVYQPNKIDYVIYDFSGDSILITRGQKEISVVERTLEGEIRTSLYDALQEAGQNIMLAFEMANIYAWTIDFYRLQKGDYFRIIYDEEQVEGETIGIGLVKAVLFNHEGKDFYGYYYVQDSLGPDYFDEAAQSLRKAFLKSPLKFSRLTSGYTRRRFHPVQKRWKAHLGTDYAAPRGTPIMATGDGKVVEAQYKKYNGNYVKIKHNSMYMTQYLHMSKIKPDIKPGTYVHQGDIIGYVGSTGLATGPHVCYRFWKHGQQVNHLREEFPPSEPVLEKNIEDFYGYIRPLQARLKAGLTDEEA